MPIRTADVPKEHLDSDGQTVIFYEKSQLDNNATFTVDTHRSRESVGVYKDVDTVETHLDLMSIFGAEPHPQGDYADAKARAAE